MSRRTSAFQMAELRGENAFVILGAVQECLNEVEDATSGLADEYFKKATSGSYEHLCQVSEEYMIKYFPAFCKKGDLYIE